MQGRSNSLANDGVLCARHVTPPLPSRCLETPFVGIYQYPKTRPLGGAATPSYTFGIFWCNEVFRLGRLGMAWDGHAGWLGVEYTRLSLDPIVVHPHAPNGMPRIATSGLQALEGKWPVREAPAGLGPGAWPHVFDAGQSHNSDRQRPVQESSGRQNAAMTHQIWA